MIVHYIDPLSRAIARTKSSLFKPLDLRKWFVVGFSAFLASLADVGLPGPSTGIRRGSKLDVEEVLYFPQRAWDWILNHPGWAIVISVALFAACIVVIVVTWLSSRGKFIFIDNVVRDQSRIVAPWYEYRKEANSFFLFNLLWGFIVSAIVAAWVYYSLIGLQAVYERTGNAGALVVPAILEGLGLFALSIVSFFVFVLFRDFVAPIMYRDRATTSKALQKFLPLFLSELFHFIGYGLFLFILSLVIVAGIVLFGCVTCCIGFLVLAIPYINSVILLPISYALRSFSIEFLEQFGPEFHIFPRRDVPPSQAMSA